MKETIQKAFNEHLNAEFYSAYLYLSMANYFASENLDGMASWMQIQTDEERLHAMKFIDFINERDGRVVLKAIDEPKFEWESPLHAFKDAYAHECEISAKINALADLAIKENDHAANQFLQWFISEQVEEEATALTIVGKLEMVGDHSMGLLMMDQELGRRTAAASDDSE